jgi:hypothetical protein
LCLWAGYVVISGIGVASCVDNMTQMQLYSEEKP